MVDKLGKNSEFAEVNIDNLDSLETALRGAKILIYITPPLSLRRTFAFFFKSDFNFSEMSLLKRQKKNCEFLSVPCANEFHNNLSIRDLFQKEFEVWILNMC